jgi:hypothetical protein
MNTRKNLVLLIAFASVSLTLFLTRTEAQGPPASSTQRFEVAIIKWDGPDRIQFITPEKSEMVRVFKLGVELPKGIRDEAFCLTWAANKLASEGWEPLNLNSTRLLLRRPVSSQ